MAWVDTKGLVKATGEVMGSPTSIQLIQRQKVHFDSHASFAKGMFPTNRPEHPDRKESRLYAWMDIAAIAGLGLAAAVEFSAPWLVMAYLLSKGEANAGIFVAAWGLLVGRTGVGLLAKLLLVEK